MLPKDVRRYFLTIEDAVSLVLEASQFAKGGEIYLLDMGDSIKIMDLAIKLIHLSGQSLKNESNPNGEIEIKITGLDPIEKLDEELIISGPKAKTFNPSISEVDINTSNEKGLLDRIEEMKFLISQGNKKNIIDAFNRFNFN
ncbi:polysaccharide biosynthesis protein [Pelagibacteraceae bacterium]|nr:polysaccharide biosynthesis protein [Pelagibacteraceae bacterium]